MCPRAERQVALLLVEREVGDVDGAGALEDAVRIVADGTVRENHGQGGAGGDVHVSTGETINSKLIRNS